MKEDAKQKLIAASQSVNTAVIILRRELPIMEAFLKEARDMESIGSIINPTLYRDSERRATSALIEPLFASAVALVRVFDAHLEQATAALAAVKNK